LATVADPGLMDRARLRTVTVDARDSDSEDNRKIGTGFVYSDGLVFACAHNREVDATYTVNRKLAKILYIDKKTDLMVLEAPTPKLPPLSFSTDYRVGEMIFFFGNVWTKKGCLKNFFSPGCICKVTPTSITTNAIFTAGVSGGVLWLVDKETPIGVVYSSHETDIIEIADAIPASQVNRTISKFGKIPGRKPVQLSLSITG
jgi:hypothetical protein